jgi:DNA polymerase III subunit delta
MLENNYFLWGEESYLIDRKIREIIAAIARENGEMPEVVEVDADEMGALELGQTLDFSPLFALSRVVIIKKPVWMGKSTRKVRKITESLQVLEDYFQRDHSGQVLIITAPENNASNPVTKLLAKKAQVINLKAPSPRELEEWCQAELTRHQVKVAPAALFRMFNSGQDMYYLQNLIEKLSLIAGAETIGIKEMEEQLDSKQEVKIFKLTDALLNRNLKAALTAFYQLQEQGEHHLLLLHMISRQYLTLSKIKYCHELGYSNAEIGEETGQKEYVVRKMLEKSTQFHRSEIRRIFERLLAVDTSFKREGKDPKILMEALLVELCG